jgi:thiol-disulfide isomerase/thioredoxin
VIRDPKPQRNQNFGALFLRKAAEPVTRPAANASGTVHLRSGDAIPCAITAIDEKGVHITSPVAESEFIPHERIKAAELVSGGSPPDLQHAKKERLLTVPRLQKASPPTHLLCARNGDFLRCRLVAMDESSLRIELQLSELDVPRDRVAQIIWFHTDELSGPEDEFEEESDSPVAAPAPPPETVTRIQVVQSSGNRVTFQPLEVDGEFVAGTSDVLGACRFKLAEIDQLIFGAQIEAAAAELAYHQWRLRPAVEPLVAQDFDASGGLAGTASPLVGQPAPDVELDLLDGGRFRLSQCKGQIVVLDFWASWCGPCMQTIPLLHEAMQEFDPDQVRLISINLEEPASHIRSVLERHKLDLTVALDVDGVAGLRYEADTIPQLVLIDREGTVARLYIGGGPEVVEQTKASIAEMLAAD